MNSTDRLEATKLLKHWKKEEAYYQTLLQNLKEELWRMKIEDFSLKASIRKEQLKRDQFNKEGVILADLERLTESGSSTPLNMKSPISSKGTHIDEATTSSMCSSFDRDDHSQSSLPQPSPSVNEETSNINDERYLEPLILKPNYADDCFAEFDN